MLINKNKQIIDTLTEVTKSGELVWIEADPNSDKRKHQRDMLALGEDGTKYETKLDFILLVLSLCLNLLLLYGLKIKIYLVVVITYMVVMILMPILFL